MENSGSVRNRRLTDALSEASNGPAGEQEVHWEWEEGWLSVLVSWVKIVVCFLWMLAMVTFWVPILLMHLPWPYTRTRLSNMGSHLAGKGLMWILGNPIKLEGMEYTKERAIYISNHASIIDIFLVMWLCPNGTVGIGKKEIMYYPLLGQAYVLANHLRIDRANPTAAIQSLKEVGNAIVQNNLSVIIFPEGTRSKDGRLQPFKKGFVHLALQMRLPIVPMVFTGTHRAVKKGNLHIRPAPLTVTFLPPISTQDWTPHKIPEYVKLLHNIFARTLPPSQRPNPTS